MIPVDTKPGTKVFASVYDGQINEGDFIRFCDRYVEYGPLICGYVPRSCVDEFVFLTRREAVDYCVAKLRAVIEELKAAEKDPDNG